MKVIKVILGIIVVLVLIVAVGGFFLYKNMDGLVLNAIESVGSEVTETEVRVGEVKLTLSAGRAELHNLTIANLAGFTEPTIFSLNEIALQIDPLTISDSVIVIDEILLDGALLTLEHKGISETNVEALMDNIQAHTSSTSNTSSSNGEMPTFMVRKLSLTNLSMKIVSPQFKAQTLTLQDIQRTNLGSRTKGLTAGELAQALMQPIMDQAEERFKREIKKGATRSIKKALNENLSDENKEKLESLKSKFKKFKTSQ